MKITPPTVLLTSGQAMTFEATDENNKPVSVEWMLSPAAEGSLEPKPGDENRPPSPSITYVAQTVTTELMVALVAVGDNGSANATISLTPRAITIVPAEVELRPGQKQRFVAIVAGRPSAPALTTPVGNTVADVTWIVSPPFGVLEPDAGSGREAVYTAVEVADDTKVSIIATSRDSGKQATGLVTLNYPPWTGRGVQFLGTYLLLVFLLVFLIVLLWPPALPSPETARADRILAEKTLEDKAGALQKSETDLAKAKVKVASAASASETKAAPGGSTTAASQNSAVASEAQAELDTATLVRERASQAEKYAQSDLERKREDETSVSNPTISTRLGKINRELDLLWLVLLSGALGAFLHMSQSFSDYVGNRTLKNNWAWWYYFRPFIGAGLALVFYAAMRGGVIAMASGSNASSAQLNPYGLVSIGALVGMFSKAAAMKLGEVFDMLFKTDKADKSKDKLNSTQAPQTGGTTAAAGTTAADGTSSAQKK